MPGIYLKQPSPDSDFTNGSFRRVDLIGHMCSNVTIRVRRTAVVAITVPMF